MKKFCISIIVVAISLVASSCSNKSIPQKMEDFVSKTEANCATYSTHDWEKSAIQYEQLVNDYVSGENQYTDSEKEVAANAMGRYHALLLKNGVEKSAAFLKELGKILPLYFDGLSNGLKENAADIESSIDSLFDDEKIEQSLNNLEETLEKLFNGTGN